MTRLVACGVAVATLAGCATRVPILEAPTGAPASGAGAPSASLEAFAERVGADRSSWDRPVTSRAATLEVSDPELGAALVALRLWPTADRHRTVAREYARLGVLDQAHEHLASAARLEPEDPAAWDGMARIWRDWGFPQMALPDAYRAVHFGAESPVVHNTLGTVLEALGRPADATAQYRQAVRLDRGAGYALANLCRVELHQQGVEQATAVCAGMLPAAVAGGEESGQ